MRNLADSLDIQFPSRNMYHSIVARALEIVVAVREAIRLLEAYAEPPETYISVTPRAGTGYGCTEAPRGLLWHRYDTDAEGAVIKARIVPPTSQNQARIEEDLRLSLRALGVRQGDAALRRRGEMVIRNYDPCISCATHFLDLRVRELTHA